MVADTEFITGPKHTANYIKKKKKNFCTWFDIIVIDNTNECRQCKGWVKFDEWLSEYRPVYLVHTSDRLSPLTFYEDVYVLFTTDPKMKLAESTKSSCVKWNLDISCTYLRPTQFKHFKNDKIPIKNNWALKNYSIKNYFVNVWNTNK